MRLQAVNNVIIIKKDKSNIDFNNLVGNGDIKQIPEPYSGYIDSIGFETDEYKIGDYIAFCDLGGAYIKTEDTELVVLTPDMIIGKLNA